MHHEQFRCILLYVYSKRRGVQRRKHKLKTYFPFKSVYFLQQQLSHTGRSMRQIVAYGKNRFSHKVAEVK